MNTIVNFYSPVLSGPTVGLGNRRNWLQSSPLYGVGRALGHVQAHIEQYKRSVNASSNLGRVENLDVPTFDDVCLEARERNIVVTKKSFGPFYKISVHFGESGGPLLGETDGFTFAPLELLHCDTMRIYTKSMKSVTSDLGLGMLGLGVLIAKATFAHGYSSGCRTAQILAINDNDETHERLVKYYKRLGFRVVYRVCGDTLADVPHMLVWGGVGTRMDADIGRQLIRWKNI